MVASAQGRDFSSNQPPVTATNLAGLRFAACRVSDWNGTRLGVDASFAHNWAAFKTAGLHRLAYWYLLPYVSATKQARFFVNAVKACGLYPGDTLIADSELLAASTDAVTAAFCTEVERSTAPGVITGVYSNHHVGCHLVSCIRWPLWFAWPSLTAPPPSFILPWTSWTWWQWGQDGWSDRDAFNGTAAAYDRWVAARQPEPVPSPDSRLEEDASMYIPLRPGDRFVVPVWEHAGVAGTTPPWTHGTLVLSGDTGTHVAVVTHTTKGVREVKGYDLYWGKSVAAGSLAGIATVAVERTDTDPKLAATAVINRW